VNSFWDVAILVPSNANTIALVEVVPWSIERIPGAVDMFLRLYFMLLFAIGFLDYAVANDLAI
jgi:hypothetical protein